MASLLIYVFAWSPEVNTKWPARNAPTFCNVSSTLLSVIVMTTISFEGAANLGIELLRALPRRIEKIFARARKNNASRRADNHAAASTIPACLNGFLQIPALSTDAGNKEGQVVSDRTYRFHFIRIRRTDHERAIAVCVPFVSDMARDMHVKRFAID